MFLFFFFPFLLCILFLLLFIDCNQWFLFIIDFITCYTSNFRQHRSTITPAAIPTCNLYYHSFNHHMDGHQKTSKPWICINTITPRRHHGLAQSIFPKMETKVFLGYSISHGALQLRLIKKKKKKKSSKSMLRSSASHQNTNWILSVRFSPDWGKRRD